MDVVFAPAAVAALIAIRNGIGHFNPAAARRMADRIKTAAEGLADFPERGRRRTDGAHDLMAVRPSVIAYDVAPGRVTVLRGSQGHRTTHEPRTPVAERKRAAHSITSAVNGRSLNGLFLDPTTPAPQLPKGAGHSRSPPSHQRCNRNGRGTSSPCPALPSLAGGDSPRTSASAVRRATRIGTVIVPRRRSSVRMTDDSVCIGQTKDSGYYHVTQ